VTYRTGPRQRQGRAEHAQDPDRPVEGLPGPIAGILMAWPRRKGPSACPYLRRCGMAALFAICRAMTSSPKTPFRSKSPVKGRHKADELPQNPRVAALARKCWKEVKRIWADANPIPPWEFRRPTHTDAPSTEEKPVPLIKVEWLGAEARQR
jgi:hypothetical protein